MDFAESEAQRDIRELARKLFAAHTAPPQLRAVEATADRVHHALWTALASAGLLGAALPDDVGGSGQGFLELCTILEEQGAAVAPVPLWATLVLGALPIARFGSAAQRRRILPGVVSGQTVLTAALCEPGVDDPLRPMCTARIERGGFVVDGRKVHVPAAAQAGWVVVPARTDADGLVLVLISPRAAGVRVESHVTTTGELQYSLELTAVRVESDDVLASAEQGRAALDWLHQHALVALCAQELGVISRALRLTAEYTTSRQQFDRPIATFQAVAQRAADAYIDVETVRLATWHAAWRLASDLPAATEATLAKYWAAEAGHRVVYAAQHLHGGIGFDVDYPLHRYYRWSRQLELTLGGATPQLARLGAELARLEEPRR